MANQAIETHSYDHYDLLQDLYISHDRGVSFISMWGRDKARLEGVKEHPPPPGKKKF